ncbi:hypothetical protein JOM56_003184 [Amanita muscaria]
MDAAWNFRNAYKEALKIAVRNEKHTEDRNLLPKFWLTKILIPVVMKSDHPVMNNRYLLYEAQLAHYHGLSTAFALSSVTSVPARAACVGHRVGAIVQGYDADIAICDSLAFKTSSTRVLKAGETVRFERVKSAWITTDDRSIVNAFREDEDESIGKGGSLVVIQDGEVPRVGNERDSSPALTTFGSPLGLVEILRLLQIMGVFDLLTDCEPDTIGNKTIVRAVDGLKFAGRDTLVINPSLSLTALRRLVFSDVGGSTWFRGEILPVVHVDSADIVATLVKLKTDYEDVMGTGLRLTFAGAGSLPHG